MSKHITLPIISGMGLTRDYSLGDRQVKALDSIDLRVQAGAFVAIMGPSGSGKSTLLYVLGGLDRPTSGEVVVAGHRISALAGEQLAAFRRETIGFVFQVFHLIPSMTALENAALPGVFTGVPRDARERRAARLLTLLGLGDRLDHRPSQLSGGQQQRVALARALFNDPPLIMGDEPTGALDSKTGHSVMQMLRNLCDRRGKTVLVVTHDPGVASYADRIIRLQDGRIIEDCLSERQAA